jgi:hypothetical protein
VTGNQKTLGAAAAALLLARPLAADRKFPVVDSALRLNRLIDSMNFPRLAQMSFRDHDRLTVIIIHQTEKGRPHSVLAVALLDRPGNPDLSYSFFNRHRGRVDHRGDAAIELLRPREEVT